MNETGKILTLEVLEHCCKDGSSGRYGLEKPHLYDGNVLATDGSTLVLVDRELFDGCDFSDCRPPDVRSVLRPIERVKAWHPIPSLENCRRCIGGITTSPCRHCSDGAHTCTCGDEHECPHCEGSSVIREHCKACRVKLANRTFRRVYINRFSALPDVLYGVASDSETDIVFFKFTGGVGAAMPLDLSKEGTA